jgi:hypothetical protein
MGYAYLGLGLGGVVAPMLINFLVQAYGWRHAMEIVGLVILVVLFPIGIWITRSVPADLGLLPDGAERIDATEGTVIGVSPASGVSGAIRTANFWRILAGSALVIGTIGSVIQHFILFLEDTGYSRATACAFDGATGVEPGRPRSCGLSGGSLTEEHRGAFYAVLSASNVAQDGAGTGDAWVFAAVFGFSMGADYVLIPLVTAECFGTASLGEVAGADHHGLFGGPMGRAVITGRNLRCVAQLRTCLENHVRRRAAWSGYALWGHHASRPVALSRRVGRGAAAIRRPTNAGTPTGAFFFGSGLAETIFGNWSRYACCAGVRQSSNFSKAVCRSSSHHGAEIYRRAIA